MHHDVGDKLAPLVVARAGLQREIASRREARGFEYVAQHGLAPVALRLVVGGERARQFAGFAAHAGCGVHECLDVLVHRGVSADEAVAEVLDVLAERREEVFERVEMRLAQGGAFVLYEVFRHGAKLRAQGRRLRLAVFGGVAALAFEQGACLHLRLFQTLHFGRRAADMKKQPEEKSGCYT